MQLRDNGLGFSPITIVLHWVSASLVFAVIGIELYRLAISGEVDTLAIQQYEHLFAVVLFFVSCYRLWARLSTFHPLPVGTPNPVEVIVARSVAVALTLAGVLLPIAGWLSMSAAGAVVGLPGGGAIPPLMGPNEAVKHVVDVLFTIGASAFLAGLALHLFGALNNHLVLKNDALRRMCGKKVEL